MSLKEYASGGELFDRIEPDFGMHHDLAHKYFYQLISGVEYIHSKGIVHRDLKPENLLLNDNDVLKIADFGLATLFQYRGNERLLSSPCGTAPYVATEVLSRSEYRAQPTDIWSCGIILIAMLAGELPWDKPVLENRDFYNWVQNDCYQRTPWCKLDNSVLALLRKMLAIDPVERLTIKQVKSSVWFTRKSLYETTFSQNNNTGYLSQPTYCYTSKFETNLINNTQASVEMQIADSNDDCDCVKSQQNNGFNTHIQSFSQPICTDNMILNSQIQNTQTISSQASQTASPLLKMVKRMTRMFVHTNVEQTIEELKKLFQKYNYEYKIATMASQRQRQITVSSFDKRQMPLTFKINLIETNMICNNVLIDFRLSKGDGLEFKKVFIKFKSSLVDIACKKYVFVTSTNANCCGKQ